MFVCLFPNFFISAFCVLSEPKHHSICIRFPVCLPVSPPCRQSRPRNALQLPGIGRRQHLVRRRHWRRWRHDQILWRRRQSIHCGMLPPRFLPECPTHNQSHLDLRRRSFPPLLPHTPFLFDKNPFLKLISFIFSNFDLYCGRVGMWVILNCVHFRCSVSRSGERRFDLVRVWNVGDGPHYRNSVSRRHSTRHDLA